MGREMLGCEDLTEERAGATEKRPSKGLEWPLREKCHRFQLCLR